MKCDSCGLELEGTTFHPGPRHCVASLRAKLAAERERAERAERRIAYNYDLLKAFDNYGSADLDVCVREVLRVVTADQPQAIAERDATIARLRIWLQRVEQQETSGGCRAVAREALAETEKAT